MTETWRDLGGGLVLRNVRDERDVREYAALHARYVSVAEGITCEKLMHAYPGASYDDYLVVEARSTKEIIATTCLIPWDFDFAGIPLKAAMLEMVVTHPDYRRRGLVRAQMERFHQMTTERGFDLCFIEGIPYYYRQFGYTYAIDHRSYDALTPVATLDPAGDGPARFGFRPATLDDIPHLVKLYCHAMTGARFRVQRDAAFWRYLLEEVQYPVWMILPQVDEAPAGYVVVSRGGESGAHIVLESALRDETAAPDVLAWLRPLAGDELRISWPQTTSLVRAARVRGSIPHPTYQWLLRIVDIPAFLRKIAPLLEQRLAASAFADLTAELIANLFTNAYVLRFTGGRLAAVEPAGFVDSSMGADGGDLCIPPDAFVRLVLGYRTLDALADAWPDIVVRGGRRPLFDILFPEITSYLSTPYFYLGPT
jgi:predicted acetyltransferase